MCQWRSVTPHIGLIHIKLIPYLEFFLLLMLLFVFFVISFFCVRLFNLTGFLGQIYIPHLCWAERVISKAMCLGSQLFQNVLFNQTKTEPTC